MLFNSLSFVVFFPVVLLFYYAVPTRMQWIVLLCASALFYMAFVPSFILILIAVIGIDYIAGRLLSKEIVPRKRFAYLLLSIIANLGILFFFKYFNFFNENAAALADVIGWNYDPWLLYIALPLGLSFHVFQSLSYVIEVYRGRYAAERHLGRYALYVLFFPQLVAGPIERPQHLLPQLHREYAFTPDGVRAGFERMLWGFFKKLVIADNLALFVNHVYADPGSANGFALLLAAVAFSIQLYCDFSGYSDIAIGAAQTFGIRLSENFSRPFAARTVADFWRRWHISLSSWLRDYLYYPLVFSGKRSVFRLNASILITFVLIGLWHGASWTYVFMGLLHGIFLTVSNLTAQARATIRHALRLEQLPRVHAIVQVTTVFCLVSVSFVFFRAATLHDGFAILNGILHAPVDFHAFLDSWAQWVRLEGGSSAKWILIAILCMECVQYAQAHWGWGYSPQGPRWFRIATYYALIVVIAWFGYFGGQAFIYFQF